MILGSPSEEAEAAQKQASNPQVSAFVSASAGSGKTKLLTDRLLRLMLHGAAPGSIHCLTYTKAAAAEMAVRLQTKLGEWVTAPDHTLDTALSSLDVTPTAASRRTARALFGRVLDLPGGMRIGTIHSFCQSLLRRFPLEASLSPHFELSDEHDIDDLLNEALEETLTAPDLPEQRAIDVLAGMVNLQALRSLIKCLRENERGWRQLSAIAAHEYRDRLAHDAGLLYTTRGDLMRAAVELPSERALRSYIPLLAGGSGKLPKDLALACQNWLDLSPEARVAYWQDWSSTWLTGSGEKRKLERMVSKALATSHPAMVEDFETEQDRVLQIQDQLASLAMIEASAHLITLAKTVLKRFDAKKTAAGVLDYGDLIAFTRNLLGNPGAPAWVRYKLDEGIDHLLLDEVQDTSPAQWDIVRMLWDEFFAGTGATDRLRTVFAVGDQKQSIYSFQGADPQSFHRERERLGHRVGNAGLDFSSPSLNVSFRSAAPVLSLVDRVFRIPPAAQGVGDAGPAGWLDHRVAREGHAGSVELWPLTPVPQPPAAQPWQIAQTYQPQISAKQRLAESLAEWIRGQTSGGVMLESRNRPLRAGDVLVLVRRRDDFVRALGRALKQRNVPVAGLDRMTLTEQPAVQDLLALCDVLLLPEDDLSLAEFLTSPLGGLSDDSLMQLAIDRGDRPLFSTLASRAGERPDWNLALEFLRTLRARVDFVPPYALLAEALGRLGGRARLLARLGPDAAEPIDELLAAALRHAELHPASLQSFLHWLRNSGAEIKREAEAAGGLVRIMTVHGAKGLQAPLVILPDTTSTSRTSNGLLFPAASLPFWVSGKDATGNFAKTALALAERFSQEEENRLLYVALTRAEDRLLICGAETKNKLADDCWYRSIERGFGELPADNSTFAAVLDPWPGDLRRYASTQVAEAAGTKTAEQTTASPPPPWLGAAPDWRPRALVPEPVLPRPLAPSRPQDSSLGLIPAANSPDQATDRFARGKLVHLLLQHLPDIVPEDRPAAAARAAQGSAIPAADTAAITASILDLITLPALAPLFGPGSRAEVPLCGLIGNRVIQGVVDRLAVLPDRVIIADYKSNRAPPLHVPVLYVRQMSAYKALISRIFPGRSVACLLIWTQDGTISHLTDADLALHAPT